MTTTINGRTPEEIKKGLECFECDGCAYSRKNNGGQARCSDVEIDALAYIQQLEAGIDRIYENVDALRGLPEKIQQLERERDAVVADMTELMQLAQFCRHCKHLTEDGECTFDFAANKDETWCWQWRGVEVE